MQFLLKTLCLGFFLHLTTAEYIVPIVPIDDGGETTTPTPIPPKCTGPHEFWTECGNDSCVRDCSSFGRSDIACRPSCNPGCICEFRYYRNADGVCVKPEECGIDVCPEPNKELVSCLSPCGENCRTLGRNITCYFLVCIPGCACKPGFFMNMKQECVSPDRCECDVNEQLDLCPNLSLPETCESIGKHNIDCPPFEKVKSSIKGTCRPACRCEQNYKRDVNKECVRITDCPQPFPCKETEEYKACPDRCLTDSCSTNDGLSCAIGALHFCHVILDVIVNPNTAGMNSNKICGGDPNAASHPCGDPCPVTCFNKDTQTTCDKPCKFGGCKCKSGYVRDLDNKCIKIEKCPPCNGDVNANPSDGCNCKTGYIKDKVSGKCAAVPPPKCSQNEVVDKCALCDDLTCAKVFAGELAGCTKPAVCPVACRCKAGYVRNDKKQCVKTENCCSDPNSELVSSLSPCAGGTCECPAFANCKTKPRAKGCRCKTGFLKKSAADVTCVAIKSCPKKAANSPVKY